jgi:hypothetical protein
MSASRPASPPARFAAIAVGGGARGSARRAGAGEQNGIAVAVSAAFPAYVALRGRGGERRIERLAARIRAAAGPPRAAVARKAAAGSGVGGSCGGAALGVIAASAGGESFSVTSATSRARSSTRRATPVDHGIRGEKRGRKWRHQRERGDCGWVGKCAL